MFPCLVDHSHLPPLKPHMLDRQTSWGVDKGRPEYDYACENNKYLPDKSVIKSSFKRIALSRNFLSFQQEISTLLLQKHYQSDQMSQPRQLNQNSHYQDIGTENTRLTNEFIASVV